MPRDKTRLALDELCLGAWQSDMRLAKIKWFQVVASDNAAPVRCQSSECKRDRERDFCLRK